MHNGIFYRCLIINVRVIRLRLSLFMFICMLLRNNLEFSSKTALSYRYLLLQVIYNWFLNIINIAPQINWKGFLSSSLISVSFSFGLVRLWSRIILMGIYRLIKVPYKPYRILILWQVKQQPSLILQTSWSCKELMSRFAQSLSIIFYYRLILYSLIKSKESRQAHQI